MHILGGAILRLKGRAAEVLADFIRSTRLDGSERRSSMDRSDWTLLVLKSGGESGLSPVQLQKSLFLLKENLGNCLAGFDLENYYQFVPYNYGPFDVTVYDDAQALANDGLAEILEVPGRRYRQYRISSEGMKLALQREKELRREVVEYIGNLVGWVKNQTFQSLLRTIYRLYPSYRENSVFQG